MFPGATGYGGVEMKDSEIYLKAAESIRFTYRGNGCWYCCDAIYAAGGLKANSAEFKFKQLFLPDASDDESLGFWEECLDWTPDGVAVPGTGKDQQARVLALCFMAAIAQSEGR